MTKAKSGDKVRKARRTYKKRPPEQASAADHPPHYGGKDNPYEVIKVLEAWMTREELKGFVKGNMIKYAARATKKGHEAEDYEKASWYAKYLAEMEK